MTLEVTVGSRWMDARCVVDGLSKKLSLTVDHPAAPTTSTSKDVSRRPMYSSRTSHTPADTHPVLSLGTSRSPVLRSSPSAHPRVASVITSTAPTLIHVQAPWAIIDTLCLHQSTV